MEPDEIMMDCEEAMEKAVNHLKHEFATVRTGKASPALVEGLDVNVVSYGMSSKLKQLAVITTPEPRLIVIQPFDVSTMADIERALKESRLGINPAVDGKIIRLPIPELSEERRKDMVKLAKTMAEEGRVGVRKARQDGMHKIKGAKLPEDEQKLYEKDIQEMTDKGITSIDESFKAKETDILTV
ncbi:MAG: ribosome recycling factor [Verrucomicrobiales bacterium]|jgi:ribosome recycling factor